MPTRSLPAQPIVVCNKCLRLQRLRQMPDYPISIYQGFAVFRIAEFKCQSWVFLWDSPTENVFYRFVGGVPRLGLTFTSSCLIALQSICCRLEKRAILRDLFEKPPLAWLKKRGFENERSGLHAHSFYKRRMSVLLHHISRVC